MDIKLPDTATLKASLEQIDGLSGHPELIHLLLTDAGENYLCCMVVPYLIRNLDIYTRHSLELWQQLVACMPELVWAFVPDEETAERILEAFYEPTIQDHAVPPFVDLTS